MKIVVINKDQPNDLLPMVIILDNENLLKDTIFVFDRCNNVMMYYVDTLSKEYGFKYIENTQGEGRQTSYCRNLGYKYFEDDIDDGVLFLDADRWPIIGHLEDLKNEKTDIVLLKNENDFRDNRDVSFSKIYGQVYNDFFSNGIYIKKEACKKLNEFYKGHEEYCNSLIFPENCQKYWGIEDTHLGDICYHLGLSCDIIDYIRLNGEFKKIDVDSIDIIEHRFKLRDKLNVSWDL